VLIPVLAFVFVSATAILRIQRVRYVTDLAGWSVAEPAGPASSSGQFPRLIVPGNRSESYEWMDQTRQMLDREDLRVRHVDYENAPFGHDVSAASPYRWWLGIVAWCCHEFSGRSTGASVEKAALFADPLINLLLLAGAAVFVVRRVGIAAAAVLSVAMAALFPFAVAFLPGAPDSQGLALALGLWSVLPLLCCTGAGPGQARGFVTAGVAGGLGLWIGVSSEVPILIGIGFGALVASWVSRGAAATPAALPWRKWALAGSAATFGAYLLEYFPSHMGSWEMRAVHPVYAVAWLGGGEALTLATGWIQRRGVGSPVRAAGRAAVAAAALASLPVAMALTHSAGFLAIEFPLLHLTRLPNAVGAPNFVDWLVQDDFSALVCATILPVLLAGPAIWLLIRRSTGLEERTAIAIALGPALVALGFACRQLSWWSGFDAAMLALLVATVSALGKTAVPRMARAACLALLALVLVPGAIQAFPKGSSGGKNALEETDVVGLIERDLARWLAIHSPPGGAVVLAPANVTTALYYYGGLKGLGTLDWENKEGVQASVRIVSATTADEAFDLITRHGVNYIVIPSWDPQLDGFAKMGLGQLEGSFIYGLHRWGLPPWLRPVPFPLPAIGGFEGQSIVVLEVTEEQDDVLLMSRIGEYFVESDNPQMASSAAQALRRYQSDLGALVARASIEQAQGEREAFSQTLESLMPLLAGEAERTLAFDRRVSLAVVLAQGQHLDRAREEVQRCFSEVSDANLRSLTTRSLYHLLVLGKAMGMGITDPGLRQLSLDLLPPDVRSRLGP